MSGIEVVGLVVGAVALAASGFTRLDQVSPQDDFHLNKKQYGTALSIYLATSQAGDVVKRVRHNVIGHDVDMDQATLVKKSFTESFTMIAVAGAIIAQIAFTGLSLDHISGTHWTAYAAFVLSLVAGCLAVYFSCSLQLLLSGLHGEQETFNWLTRPATSQLPAHPVRDTFGRPTPASPPAPASPGRVPSSTAAILLVTPAQLLNFSLAAFLVGLGIYLGFSYTQALPETDGRNSSLVILIIYIIFTVSFIVMYGYPYGLKYVETSNDSKTKQATEREFERRRISEDKGARMLQSLMPDGGKQVPTGS